MIKPLLDRVLGRKAKISVLMVCSGNTPRPYERSLPVHFLFT
ncbi:hypothetical protein [Pelomonas sp. V22]|nr:hypothetical protein [Pelomonas sp. V22]